MFDFDSERSFADRERMVSLFWDKNTIFARSISQREKAPLFATYDGPPFATGLPHYGHILAGTIKDTVLRYKTMRGFSVPRRFGWDCHGLPIENIIEKEHGLKGAPSIEAFGIAKFNEECRNIVLKHASEWEETVKKTGRWVDFNETYKTLDPTFMESVWWVFAELYKKGLVYQGVKVMPYSAQLGTPLSNFEANLNYKEVDDPSIVLLFSLKYEEKTSLLAWTTTPWTLPSNLALGVNSDIEYTKLRKIGGDHYYILATARVPFHFKKEEIEEIERFKGSKLVGQVYEPLFPYFKDTENAFRILEAKFVGQEDGTGIVHLAPAFGEADFDVCVKEGIKPICPIDQNGHFTREVPDFEGQFVKNADKEIIKRMKLEGKLYSQGTIHHRYPFCWRSDTPLLYRTVPTWFIAVEKLQDKLIEANQKINWIPSHVKDGRFGKWLENARDWAVSRNRFWGTPIPIWMSPSGKTIVLSSVEELEEKAGVKVADLHRHFIDSLTFTEGGEVYTRVPEVFDCWFESGSMPYAQNHYPFENEKSTMEAFPADFIAEGLDQTRGWFYTLHVLSVALFNKPAFKNVIVNGIVLAEDGQKMSKKLKNYPDPTVVLDKYGADVVRLYLLSSPAVAAEDVRFSERGVEVLLRSVMIPFWNSFVFLSTYAKIYAWKPKALTTAPKADIDRWILSRFEGLKEEVTKKMDGYLLSEATAPLISFIDSLTNWYIRRCRSRFWNEKESEDRDEAFLTLYHVLLGLAKLSAPFIPFMSESIYQELKLETDEDSVHLCDFPVVGLSLRDLKLEHEMDLLQKVVSAGHSLRKQEKIKVRQPLRKAHLVTTDQDNLEALTRQKELILAELNVWEIEIHKEESDFVTLSIKPNFQTLGKRAGKYMRRLQEVIASFDAKTRRILFEGGEVLVDLLDGEKMTLSASDLLIARQVKEGLVAETVDGVTVAFDIALDEDLIESGLAREFVNKINTMRRDQKFAVSDRIVLFIQTTERAKKAFFAHKDYIAHEVLAKEFSFDGELAGQEWDLNGERTLIRIVKAT